MRLREFLNPVFHRAVRETRALHRAIYSAAAGDHNDWDTFDRVIVGERHAAVLVIPERIYSNPVK